MYRKKVYGKSRIDKCPFCGRAATSKNDQGIPVCINHISETLPDMKCLCGEHLELRTGKWGPFFSCVNCGNISLSKALEMTGFKMYDAGSKHKTLPGKRNSKPAKEINITSDDIGVYY